MSQSQKILAVVGCGNIGSRLLQSAAGIPLDNLSVIGVEPFDTARALSAERFAQISRTDGGPSHALTMVESSSDLPASVDLLIIASSAHQRMDALTAALSATRPKTVILEKVLFTRLSDYDRAEDRLSEIPCWVNTTRNIWPGYKALKAQLMDQPVHLTVRGSDWNLASNGIHFLSLIEMLSGSHIVDLVVTDGEARSAKRADYRDMTGTLTATLDDGSTATLQSAQGEGEPLSVKIVQGDVVYAVEESAGRINGEPFQMWHASQLSGPFLEILTTQTSGLPTLAHSSRLHRLYLGTLQPYIHGLDADTDLCMIT